MMKHTAWANGFAKKGSEDMNFRKDDLALHFSASIESENTEELFVCQTF
jgi:hypothetical protein